MSEISIDSQTLILLNGLLLIS